MTKKRDMRRKPIPASDEQHEYGLSKITPTHPMSPPDLPYKPARPKNPERPIAVVGCGEVSRHHLTAYTNAGFNIVALCDLDKQKAEARRKAFYPDAAVYTDIQKLLKRDDVEIIDLTPHPAQRAGLLEQAIESGKHILSQKPFVLDLDFGQRLVDHADRRNVNLAVNQNGRWSPHFCYIRQAVKAGLIGEVCSLNLAVHWDHTWTQGTPFEEIHHLILFDFGIHWFDILVHLFEPRDPTRVFGSVARAAGQPIKPPCLAQVLVEYADGQAGIFFDARVQFGQEDRTVAAGTTGSIISVGQTYSEQTLTLYTQKGFGSPVLEGTWFPDGFQGAMAELLCAIEQNRQPDHNARENLDSLALCFAAIQSAETGQPQTPGAVRKMPRT